MEQDLGRACRYHIADSKDVLPVVLIGAKGLTCIELPKRETRSKSKPRNPLHNLISDSRVGWSTTGHHDVPSDPSEQSQYYREHTQPKQDGSKRHFDSGRQGSTDWRNNPRRFMLIGLPQIGKTGACPGDKCPLTHTLLGTDIGMHANTKIK